MQSFIDQTFMAASARANCSATPVKRKAKHVFHCCFSIIQPPSQMKGNQISVLDLSHSATIS